MAVAVVLPKVKSNDLQELWDSIADLSKEQIHGNWKLKEQLTKRLDKNPEELDCIIKFLQTKSDAIPEAVTLLVNAIQATKETTQRTIARQLLLEAGKEEAPGPITKFLNHGMFYTLFPDKVLPAILSQSPPTLSAVHLIDLKFVKENEDGRKSEATEDVKKWVKNAAVSSESPPLVKEAAFRVAAELDPKFAEQALQRAPASKEEMLATARLIGKSFELATGAEASEKILGHLLGSNFTVTGKDIETLLTGEGKFAAFLLLPKCTEPLSEQAQAGLLNLAKRGGFSPAIATENALAWAKHNPSTAAKFLIEVGSLHGIGKENRQELTATLARYSISTIEKSFTTESLTSNPQRAETLVQALMKFSGNATRPDEPKKLILKLLPFVRPEFLGTAMQELKISSFPPEAIGNFLTESRRASDIHTRMEVIQEILKSAVDATKPAYKRELKKFFDADGEIKTSKQIEETGLRVVCGFQEVDKIASVAFKSKETAESFIRGLSQLYLATDPSIQDLATPTARKALARGDYAPDVEPLLISHTNFRGAESKRLIKYAQSTNLKTAASALDEIASTDTKEGKQFFRDTFFNLPEERQRELLNEFGRIISADILQPDLPKFLRDPVAGAAAYKLLASYGEPKAELLNNPDFIRHALLDVVQSGFIYSRVKALFAADPRFKAVLELESATYKDAKTVLEVINLAAEKDRVELASSAYFRSINRSNYPWDLIESLTKSFPSITDEKLLLQSANRDSSTEEHTWAIRTLSKTKPEYLKLVASELVNYHKSETQAVDSGSVGQLETAIVEAAKSQNKTVSSVLRENLPETAEAQKLIDLYSRAEKVNIQLPLRIPPEQRESVLATLENPPKPSEGKKITLVAITKSDYNFAFYGQVKEFFRQAAANGEEVIWREVENPANDLKTIFSDARLNGSDLTVILAGHGSHQNISFGPVGGGSLKLNRAVSEDLGRLDLQSQAKRIRVILDSCLTGRHERYVPPISYSLRRNNFPNAEFISAPVISPTREGVLRQTEDQQIRGAIYEGNLENEIQTD